MCCPSLEGNAAEERTGYNQAMDRLVQGKRCEGTLERYLGVFSITKIVGVRVS